MEVSLKWAKNVFLVTTCFAETNLIEKDDSEESSFSGWDGKTRTCGYQNQNLGPYHLATSQ